MGVNRIEVRTRLNGDELDTLETLVRKGFGPSTLICGIPYRIVAFINGSIEEGVQRMTLVKTSYQEINTEGGVLTAFDILSIREVV